VTADLQATRDEVEELRKQEQSRPKDAALHLELARKYRRLGDTVMATQELHIAVDADRSCYPCYLEMGTLYFELRHWDLSIRALRRAARLRPDDPAPHLHLGDVFYKVRNGKEARGAYAKALSLGLEGPEQKRARDRLAELKDGKYMIEVLPGARKKKPESPNGKGQTP
jgi:Flp pilus assembly protein TadD